MNQPDVSWVFANPESGRPTGRTFLAMIRVRCGVRQDVVNFEVYDTPANMHRAIARLRGVRVTKEIRTASALCLRYRKDELQGGHWTRSPHLATVFLNETELEPDVVMHECIHAAIGWAKRRKIDPRQPRQEERFVEVAHRLYLEFDKQYQAHRPLTIMAPPATLRALNESNQKAA